MDYTVKRTAAPVPLDGDPTTGVWQEAEAVGMKDAMSGETPKLGTTFRMLYDDENLYVGYEVEDNQIVATHTEHDSPLYEEDVVEIFASPSGNLHYYYEFNFSPNEVVFDAIVLNDNGREGEGRGDLFVPLKAWDCNGLELKVLKQDSGAWSVTVAVPFKELHLAGNRVPASGEQWRANLFRIEYGADKPEFSAWSPTGICDFHTSEKFGTLVFG